MDLPRIAGVGGGVGTSILAAALHARDCGIYRGGEVVDVLVCRATMSSLGNAQRAISATPRLPVLAVVADIPGSSLAASARARLHMTEPHVAAVVTIPFVTTWRERDDPWQEASAVLADVELPRPVRGFAAAIRDLVDEVTPLLFSQAPPQADPMPRPTGRPSAPHPTPYPVPASWPAAH